MCSGQQILHVGVAGLGRMGSKHALNFLRLVPRAKLVAVCSPAEHERVWARENLEPHGVQVFESYDDMLQVPGLQAVIIASITSAHVLQALGALDKGLHVLCEKPISTSVPELEKLVERMDAGTAEGSLMVAFMRRFDDSYRDAYTKMKAGAIGEPLIYRSHSCDRAIDSPAFREYLVTSGGIFTDATIHDIDLSLMFLGDDSIPKSAYAVGMAAKYKELEAVGDVDNGIGIVEFWSGRIAYYYESRTSAHGFDNVCELWGTDGKLMVNSTPRKNRVQLCGRDGYTKVEPDLTWYDRYVPAYVDEANTWVDAILDAEPLPIPLRSSLKSLIIANGLMESLRTGRKVEFTKEGNPMPA